MGVEFRIIRKDNKTVFDLGKRLSHEILDVCFSKEELLEYLIVWQIQLWEDDADVTCVLIIRDRLLDFVEGADFDDLEVVGDTSWDGEASDCVNYTFTHDRYIDKGEAAEYRRLLKKGDNRKYIKNPVEFFKNSGISNGTQVESNNRNKEMWLI